MDKVWFVTMHTGYCGSDGHDVIVLPASYTDEEVQEIAWQMALENAAMYGYYPPSDGDSEWEDEEDMDGDGDNVSSNIEGYAVPYDPELHDGHSMGGSFAKEIERQVATMQRI